MIGIGVLVFVFLQPRRGTLEWHKEKYLAACDMRWNRKVESLRSWIMRDYERAVSFDVEGMLRHESALLRLGFLERREFIISNRPLYSVLNHVGGWMVRSPNRNFYRDTTPGTNRIVIVAAREDMPYIERLLAEADLPENGK